MSENTIPERTAELTPSEIKLQLEVEKLQKEIKEIRRRSHPLMMCCNGPLPVLLSLITLIYVFNNSGLQSRESKLNLEKAALLLDIKNLEMERAEVKASIVNFRADSARLVMSNIAVHDSLTICTRQLSTFGGSFPQYFKVTPPRSFKKGVTLNRL